MKKISKVLSFLLAVALIFSICTFSVSAATCTAEGTTGKTFAVNDTVTITFRYDAGQPIYTAEGTVTFDPSKLKFTSANVRYSSTATTVSFLDDELSTDTKQVSKGTYQFKFTALAEGTTNVSISLFGNNIDLQRLEASSSATVTIKNPEPPVQSTPDNTDEPEKPSNNASLSSLKVSNATLSPTFKANTTKYTAKVKSDVQKVTITGNAVDGGTCEGLGTFNIKDGENVRYITVTAADGKTKKYYTVTIIRSEEADNPDEPDLPVDPLAVKIDDADYTVIADAPAAIPAGFTADTATFGETEVGVLKSADGKIVLYTLKANESGSTDYYTYDKSKNEFSLLKYGVINGKMYVFADTKAGSADGYKKAELNLGNSTINAYKSTNSKLSDFYIIYCYVDGKYGYYSYDSVENTLQRAPAFKLTGSADTDEEKEVISSIKDLPKLSTEGKAIIIVLAVIVICVILLIVLVIVRFVKLRKIIDEDNFELEDGNNLFDEVHVEDTSKGTEDNSNF